MSQSSTDKLCDFDSIYSEDFINELHKKLDIKKEIIKNLTSEFKTILQPEIESHYLSHLVSSIENIINKKIRDEFFKRFKNDFSKMDRKEAIALINFLKNEKLRFYPILLRASNKLPMPAKMDMMKNNGSIIYYNSSHDLKEIRIFIAHELGHIYFNCISKIEKANNIELEEDYANLFAMLAMCDKHIFYTKKCKEFTEKNCLQAINKVNSLLSYHKLRKINKNKQR